MNGPGPEHKRLQEDREHGTNWETCLDCGAQWDADSGEQVTDGDESCLEEED